MSRHNSVWSRVGGAVGLLIGLTGFGLVLFRLVDGWPAVSAALNDGQPMVALASVGVGLLGMSSIGTNWWVLLNRLGATVGLVQALFRYFVGQLGKYIPGGVWPIVGRAEMARRGGVAGSTAYASTLLSLALTYLAALMSAAIFLAIAGSSDSTWPWATWVLLAIPVGLMLLHPKALAAALSLVQRVTGRRAEVPIPPWSSTVVLALTHIPAWLAIAGATQLAAVAIGGDEAFAQIAFATCVSWFLGFVVVGLPGGLGVREAAFIALSGSLDPGVAAAVALVSRMVFITVDLTGAGLASLGARLLQRKIET